MRATRFRKSIFAFLVFTTASVEAQISVNLGVNPTIDFTASPLNVLEWATQDNILPGAALTYEDPAALDAAVQTIPQSAIVTALPVNAGIGTARVARQNTTAGNVFTQPTGVPLAVLKATLRNISGGNIDTLTVAYAFGIGAAPVTDAVPGQRVFWSLTGAVNTWTLIPEFSGLTVAGPVSATLPVGTWANASDIFLLWADDNNLTGADGSFNIDNIVLTASGGPSITITITNQPDSIVVNERSPASFTVGADGSPQSFHWRSNGVPIPGANNATYSIPFAPYSADGTVFSCIVSNSVNSPTSAGATLTVTPDTIPPRIVNVDGNLGLNTVTISFSEPAPETSRTTNYSVYLTGSDPDAGLTTLSAMVANVTNIVLTTDPRIFGSNYSVRILNVYDTASTPNLVSPNPTTLALPSSNAASFLIIPINQTWKYIVPTDSSFCLDGTGWEARGFDDSAWASGPGGFTGGENDAAILASGWVNTTSLPAPYLLGGRPYYFRTHFNLASTNGLTLSFTNRIDDQAVWYLNGVRIMDRLHPNNPETCIPGGSVGPEAVSNISFTLTAANLGGIVVVGDNVLAVSVHQGNAFSSDMVFGTTMSGESASPPTIDLVTSSLIAPGTAVVQASINVQWAVQNQGSNSTPATWTDRLYLSSDSILDGADIYVGGVTRNQPLPAGSNYTQSTSVSLPAVNAGNYFLILRTDADGQVFESSDTNNDIATPIQISTPDLVVDSVTVPSAAQFGQTLNVVWTARNAGAGSAVANWADYLYLSSDAVFGSDTLLATLSGPITPLDAGQSYTRTQTVLVPLNTSFSPGNYFVLVKTDGGNAQFEADENNNVTASAALNLTPPPLPDLAVSEITAPVEALSGQTIQISWTITNRGTATATGPWNDEVLLSPDGTNINAAQSFGQFPFTGTIAPASSITRVQTIQIPIDWMGPRWLVIRTDSGNNIYEHFNETNNITIDDRSIDVRLSPFPNLQVSHVIAPSSAFSGQQTVIEWGVTNVGNGGTSAAGWWDNVWLSQDAALDGADVFLGQSPNGSYLNPGESYLNSLTATLPRGIDGDYYFIIKADANNNVYEPANENDNLLTGGPTHINLTPPPDLQVVGIISPLQTFSGQSVSVSWTATNAGPGGTVDSSWYDRVFISRTNILDGSAIALGTAAHNGALNGGQTYTVSNFSVILPVGISGNYFFLARTDDGNQVYEHVFESNNTTADNRSTVVNLTPPPDLEVQSIAAPSNALAGHNLPISYRMANSGASATPNASWNDQVFLSSDTNLDGADLLLTTQTHYGVLDAGSSYSNSVTVSLPNGLSGDFYMIVRVDSGAAVFELNRSNNIAAATTRTSVQSLPPDLLVNAFQAPATAEAGEAMLLSWSVLNSGTGDTVNSRWNDRVILSTDLLIGNADDVILLERQRDGLLAPGGGYSVSNQLVQIPFTVVPDTYRLFVLTDSGNVVFEGAYETNNASAPRAVTVSRQTADLRITSATAPAAAQSQDAITVNWTVQNFGAGSTRANYWSDSVYLSTNPILDAGDTLLGSRQHVNDLLPGGFYSSSLTAPLPSGLQGQFYVIVFTDSDNRVIEAASEANNTALATDMITVTPRPPQPTPDLVVTNVDVAIAAVSGQSIPVIWTVRNLGEAAASGTWHDAVYLSLDQFFDVGSDMYIGFANRLRPLAAGEEYTVTNIFGIPSGISGPFYVFVATDGGNVLDEDGRKSNNVEYDPISVLVSLQPPADLVVQTIAIPATGVSGQGVTITYTVDNQGANSARGLWTDSIYISVDDRWDIEDALFGRVTHAGDVAIGGSYTETRTAPLPGVLPASYHVIVRTDIRNNIQESDEANNTGGSAGTFVVDATELHLDVPYSSALRSGQEAYFKLFVPGGEDLRVTLSSTNANGANELYVRYGSMPNRSEFDFNDGTPFSPNQEITVPTTKAGWYYALLRGENPSDEFAGYTILARFLQASILSVVPAVAGDDGETTFRITGSKLNGVTSAVLTRNGVAVAANAVQEVSSTEIYVRFPTAGLQHGGWNIALNTAGGTLVSSNVISIVESIPPELEIVLIGNQSARPGVASHLSAVLRNNSNRNIERAVVRITFPESTRVEAFSLLGVQGNHDLDTFLDGQGRRVLPLLVYNMQPGTQKSVDMNLTLTEAGSHVVSTEVAVLDRPAFGNAYAQTVQTGVQNGWMTSACGGFEDDPSLCAEWRRRNYVADVFEDAHNLVFKGFEFVYGAINPSNPQDVVEVAIDQVDRTGLITHFIGIFDFFYELIKFKAKWDRLNPNAYEVVGVRSIDPNEIVGPSGSGPEAFVGSQQSLQYTVYFENLSTAAAPAHRISITSQLDPNLDARSARLGEIALGTNSILIPANRSYYQSRFSLGPENGSILADVIGVVDVQTGQIRWTLTAIDPITGEEPENALLGLLPPNDTNHVGEGHVTFTIKPRASLATGTLITNKATIVFDINAPIETNPVWNTIDGGNPSSFVAAMTNVVLDTTFHVVWLASDDAAGSGLASYSIYVADNGGPFELWLGNTTLIEAPYVGQRGHTYSFYSVARDNAGNVESFPTSPDATVYVSDNVPPTFLPLANFTVSAGIQLLITNGASDANIPTQRLMFAFVSAPPSGASITSNGIFRWRPTAIHAGTTNTVFVRVTDDGIPSLSGTQSFTVVVRDYVEPGLGVFVLRAGETGSVPIRVYSSAPLINLNLSLLYPPNVLSNFALRAVAPSIGVANIQQASPTLSLLNFTNRPGEYLQGTQQVALLDFVALPNQRSAFVPILITNIQAMRADGTFIPDITAQASRIVIIGAEPLVEASMGTIGQRSLVLFGKPQTAYVLESTTSLETPVAWHFERQETTTDITHVFNGLPSTNRMIFYRIREE